MIQPSCTPAVLNHEYCYGPTVTTPNILETTCEVTVQTELTIADIDRIIVENEQLPSQEGSNHGLLRHLLVQKVTEDDNSVQQYIGFQNKETMEGIYSLLKEGEGKLNYASSFTDLPDCPSNKSGKRPGPARKLSFREEFILCMLRLKLGLHIGFLSLLFEVSNTHVTQVFNTWIDFMHQILVPSLIVWPSQQVNRLTMPVSIRRKFPNLTCTIDCFELFTQKPRAPTPQCQTYSSYKSHNTLKVLVSITPNGSFNFVSSAWSGNVSDKHITKHSGFLDKVEADDMIMADRGFTIQDLLLERKASLIIPPFTRKCSWGKGKRLNLDEIQKTRNIAQTRIHVERAIGRLKNYQLLSCVIPLTMKERMTSIIKVAAALCNLQPPLVK